MVVLMKRQPMEVETRDVFDRLDQLFDEWSRFLPLRMPVGLEPRSELGEFIRVDEYREGDRLVVRAELPGIDPEKDVDITVSDRTLHIEAERREEEDTDKKGFLRHELRYGHYSRLLPLPEGVTESDVSATYTDGILEISVKVPAGTEPTRIPVTKG